MTRWHLSLQLFSFVVRYRKGGAHINADYFSPTGTMGSRRRVPDGTHWGGMCEAETSPRGTLQSVPLW